MGLFNFFKKMKTENEVSKWQNREKPYFKIETIGPINGLVTEYDLNNIRAIGTSKKTWWYLLEGSNKNVAIKDILLLNKYIAEHAKSNPKISKVRLYESSIRFYEYGRATENDDFTRLLVNPYTEKGNLKKYPLILKFKTLSNDEDFASISNGKPNIFGEIHYLKSGDIGKYRVIIWIQHNMYEIKGNYK